MAFTNPLAESLAGYTGFAEVVNDGLAVVSTLPDEEDVNVRPAEVVNEALAEDLSNGPAEVFTNALADALVGNGGVVVVVYERFAEVFMIPDVEDFNDGPAEVVNDRLVEVFNNGSAEVTANALVDAEACNGWVAAVVDDGIAEVFMLPDVKDINYGLAVATCASKADLR